MFDLEIPRQIVVATPFITGALIQLIGHCITSHVSGEFNDDFDNAMNASTENTYALPARFSEEMIKARFPRDIDTVLAIVTLVSVLPQMIILVQPASAAFVFGVIVLAVAPLLVYLKLSKWNPINYASATKKLWLSPVTLVSLILYGILIVIAVVTEPASSVVQS